MPRFHYTQELFKTWTGASERSGPVMKAQSRRRPADRCVNSIRFSLFELGRVFPVPGTLSVSVHSVQLRVLPHSLPEPPHGVRTAGQRLGQRSATGPAPCEGHGQPLWREGAVRDWKKTNTKPFNFRADISDCACTNHASMIKAKSC